MPSTELIVTFVKGVRCGGCGEILPDQEIASGCLCARLRAIECLCPDAFRDNGLAVDYCPSDGKARQANEQAAERRGPWYGQPALATGSRP
jgi:hypothetical protein